MKAVVGLAIVAAHAAGFVALAARSGGTELAVEVSSPIASPSATLNGVVPASLAARVETEPLASGPGLVRRRWRTRYRGGFQREVGATQLVGPFQDPAAPPCSGRIVVGQRLLDASAPELAKVIDAQLRGEVVFPVGDYQRIDKLTLTWARLEARPADRDFVGDAPHGYVRAAVTVAFDRVDVPLVVAFVPEPPAQAGDALHFRVAVHAELAFGDRYVQWLSDKLGVAQLATRLARGQLDDALVTTLAPPPPFELPDGQTLRFSYCDAPIDVADRAWGALRFAVAIAPAVGATAILPPRFPPAPLPAPDADVTLALDLEPNALDAMLYELWRTGWLDRRLADAGLDRRFDADPTVAEFLSVRLAPLHLALPPVIDADPRGGLRLAADARVAISDGAEVTTGRVWGALRFTFAPATQREQLPVAVALGQLELACERTPTTLVPCYADLVAALRDRGSDFDGALTDRFAQLLAEIFVDRRLAADGVPGTLLVRGVAPRLDGAVLHLALDATVSAGVQ